MTAAERAAVRDAVVTAPGDRREVVVQAIRQARERLALSLYRCNDQAIFDELKQARERGVQVDVLVTSRSGGGRKRLRKLWRALEETGVSLHPHTDPVVKYHAKYLVADDGPGAGRVAELHAQVLRQDHRCDRRHLRSGRRERPARTC